MHLIRRSLLAVAIGVTLVTGCTAGNADPSAPYFPATRPAASTPAPVDPALTVPAAPLGTATGPVSRPNPQVTPGAVAVHDVAALCGQAKRVAHQRVSAAWTATVFSGYGISKQDQGKYKLDYLVPVELGGAESLPNLWPVAVKGIGYYEKQRLDAKLRIAVCQGQISLDQAQRGIATDWFSLWAQYAAS